MLPPTEDELYYWNWAQHLQASYFDHPPMVAVLIRVSTAIFGDGLFGLRFFAVLLSFFLMYLVGHWCGRKEVVTLVLFTPLVFFGSMLITPDIPFLFFWGLYVWWLMSINGTFSPWSDDPVNRVYHSSPVPFGKWVVGGAILGLGLLSKYSMLLAIPCAFLVMFTRYRIRAWFSGFVLHLAIAGLFCLPVILFNMKHQWAPFLFQFNHALSGSTSGYFTRYVGSQIALVGLLPFLMLPWIAIRLRDLLQHPLLNVALWFFAIPFFFALFQGRSNYVEANWALMSYLTFWPIAQRLFNRNTIGFLGKPLLWIGFAPALVFTALGFVHTIYPLKQISPEKDRLARIKEQMNLIQTVTKDLRENDVQAPLYSTNYQLIAAFRYYGHPNTYQFPLTTRPSNFSFDTEDPCKYTEILSIHVSGENMPGVQCFPQRETLREYMLAVKGKPITQYELVRYYRLPE